MKKIKKQLGDVEKEIIEGKKLVREKKRAARNADTFVERDNKVRALRTAMQGVEAAKAQREVLEDTEVKKSAGRRGSGNKRRRSGRKRHRVKRVAR